MHPRGNVLDGQGCLLSQADGNRRFDLVAPAPVTARKLHLPANSAYQALGVPIEDGLFRRGTTAAGGSRLRRSFSRRKKSSRERQCDSVSEDGGPDPSSNWQHPDARAMGRPAEIPLPGGRMSVLTLREHKSKRPRRLYRGGEAAVTGTSGASSHGTLAWVKSLSSKWMSRLAGPVTRAKTSVPGTARA